MMGFIVAGWWFPNRIFFSIIWYVILPIELIFSKMVKTTNQVGLCWFYNGFISYYIIVYDGLLEKVWTKKKR